MQQHNQLEVVWEISISFTRIMEEFMATGLLGSTSEERFASAWDLLQRCAVQGLATNAVGYGPRKKARVSSSSQAE